MRLFALNLEIGGPFGHAGPSKGRASHSDRVSPRTAAIHEELGTDTSGAGLKYCRYNTMTGIVQYNAIPIRILASVFRYMIATCAPTIRLPVLNASRLDEPLFRR